MTQVNTPFIAKPKSVKENHQVPKLEDLGQGCFHHVQALLRSLLKPKVTKVISTANTHESNR